MSRQDIGKFSWSYELVRRIGIMYHRLYYRKLILKHKEKIPVNSPVIFAVNHQNALMDALALVYTLNRQIVFMARADIFRKKMTASLLYFLKILPAYRIRDGFHSVDQNKDVFKEVISALGHNRPAAILPEGNHVGEKRLRQLKKGAARLAFLAEEANGFKLGLSIVPVGLDYSNYYHAGSDLLIVFGDPIPAGAYREQYLQNPTLAINNLTNDLAVAMKKVMLDIEPAEHYQTIKNAIDICGPIELKKQNLKASLWNSFIIKKELSEKITGNISEKEPQLNALKETLDTYNRDLKKHGIRNGQITQTSGNRVSLILKVFLSLILLPVHLYGMVLNFLPYGLPIYLARNIKDPHFISSVRFVLGMLFFLIWHIILIIISLIVFKPVLLSLAFIISVPLTGIFSFYYYRNLLKMRGDFRAAWLKLKNRKAYDSLTNQYRDITTKFGELI